MRHARSDYNGIQDASGKIPDDEPVFVLRAQDTNAPDVVRLWCQLSSEDGANSKMVMAASAWADVMEDWQYHHGSKVPDVPEGVFE